MPSKYRMDGKYDRHSCKTSVYLNIWCESDAMPVQNIIQQFIL